MTTTLRMKYGSKRWKPGTKVRAATLDEARLMFPSISFRPESPFVCVVIENLGPVVCLRKEISYA